MARKRREYGGVVTKNYNMTISAFVVAIIPRRKPAKKVPISGRLLLLIVPHRCSASGKPWTEGTPNFAVLQKWNDSEVYAKTVAYFANRLAKEP